MAQQQPERPQVPPDMKEFNRKVIEEHRANQGRLSGQLAQSHLILLTTRGRRSGEPQTVVLGWVPDGHAMVVIASNNGAQDDPEWFKNLEQHPVATVEVGAKKFEVRARVTEGDERDRLGGAVPYLERQQALTKRLIPVVVLEPHVA